jgi:GT2 family glycosyltransferase
MSSESVEVSVIIVCYNNEADLGTCLSSVCDQSLDDYEVIVVDNGSTDGSVQYVRDHHPEVRLVENESNRWFTGGNNDGVAAARGEYLAFVNPDVAVEPDWLEELIRPLRDDESVGLSTSRIVRYGEPDRLNACGNVAHYTGLGFCRGLDDGPKAYSTQESVPAVSGCSFAVRRSVYEEVGGFDELFEMYYEDLDLSWRVQLAGYDIVTAPESVLYHKYEFSIPEWKLFNMERNRYMILLKHLRRGTLLRLAPGLLLTELLIWAYAAMSGRESLRSKAATWVWIARNREEIGRSRRETQRLRERSDGELLSRLDRTIPVEQFGLPKTVQRICGPLLTVGYRFGASLVSPGSHRGRETEREPDPSTPSGPPTTEESGAVEGPQ